MAAKIKNNKEYIFELPKLEDSRGNLSFLEEDVQIPFPVARVYWIYDVPGGQKRGSHAFKTQQEIIIALSGSFDVVLHDGSEERRHHLNRSYKALYVPPRMWRSLENFATNSVCLVISSGNYDEKEYITNFKEFRQYIKQETYNPELSSGSNEKAFSIEPRDTQENYTIYDCPLVELPVVSNRAGNLTAVHNSVEIPFDVKRIFFVYDIPYGKTRGMHAHKRCHQFLLAAGGSFDIELDDGLNKKIVNLNRPMQGIYVTPDIWMKEMNYSSGSVCLVLASQEYSEGDYIRKYSDFKQIYGNKHTKI